MSVPTVGRKASRPFSQPWTMDTGLALLYLHQKIPLDTTASLDEFARRHERKLEMFNVNQSINHSFNQISIAPISPAKPGSVVRQPNWCSIAKSKKQFRSINRLLGVPVSMRERERQREVSNILLDNE